MIERFIKLLLFTVLLATFLQARADEVPPRGTIKGRVLTSDHKPAENVTVALQGTKHGTVTDNNGYYTLSAPAGSYTLTVSYVGIASVSQSVEIKAGESAVIPDVLLSNSQNSLQEVQINGVKNNRFAVKKSNDVAKMPLTQLENPQAYTTISPELLQEQAVLTVDNAIKNAPGIQSMWNATGRSGDGGSYYNSRGFIVQSQLRNGVSGNVSNTVDIANIESIEVIKGPSGTLYGSALTSYGGLINRVTKKPYDDFGGQVTYTSGNYDYSRTSLDLNTPLNGKKNLLFRLNTAYNYNNSYLDKGQTKNFVFDPSFLYKVNDRLSIQLDAELYYGRTSGRPIYFFPYGQTIAQLGADRADELSIDYKKLYYSSDLTQRSRTVNFFGQVNYKISEQWKSQTYFTSTNSFSNGYSPYFYLLAGNQTIDREDQSTGNSKSNNLEIQEIVNGDFKIGDLRNRIVIGLDYFHLNNNQFFFGGDFDQVPTRSATLNYNLFNAANLGAIYAAGKLSYTYPVIYKADTYSAFASDVLNITDRLSALAALRVDGYHNHGTYNTSGMQTVDPYNQTAVSPKFGLVYQLIENELSLFGNYQNGFNNPGVYTAYDAASKTGVSRIAKVQNANQAEGGIKANLFSGKLTGTLSYYNINVSNVLRTDAAASVFAQIQDGTQRSRGIEAEVIANPFAGFNIVSGFSYNESKYTKADADVVGRRPATAASPYTANLWLSYRLQAAAVKGLGFGFGGNYASDNEVVNSVSQGVFTLPSFIVLNVGAFYDQPKYRFGLNISNLNNKKYYIGYTTVNPQNLRQYLASFAYKF